MSEERLPTVSGQNDGAGGPSDSAAPGDAGDPSPHEGAPVRVESSSARLVGTLAVAGSLAGLAIVVVFQWANPRIEAWRAQVLSEAVTEVLAGADRYETVFLDEGGFTTAPAGDTTGLDRVYVGYDGSGIPVGVAMVGAAAGFQDVIRVIFGYDPDSGEVMGMQVLESKETPGLGDKIEKDSTFIDEFDRVATPLVGRKASRETGSEDEVVMITGATISSQTIVDIINARVEEVGAEVGTFWRSTAVSASSARADDGATGRPSAGGGHPHATVTVDRPTPGGLP